MKKISLVFLFGLLLFGSCIHDDNSRRRKAPENVEAYVAVYAPPPSEELRISGEEKRPTILPGKILVTPRYIFQNEIQKGVHVIDRASKQKVAFINIPFSTELAVRNNILYTNYISDLLAIDIGNPLKPILLRREKNVFSPVNQDYPPYNGYFVCPDKSQKGIIAYWELQKVETAKCQR